MYYKMSIVAKTPEELKQKIKELCECENHKTTIRVEPTLQQSAGVMTPEPDQVPTAVSEILNENEEVNHPVLSSIADAVDALKGELDVRGMPWDSRIHSANKTKNGKGEWRKQRGVDAELVRQVEEQYKTAKIDVKLEDANGTVVGEIKNTTSDELARLATPAVVPQTVAAVPEKVSSIVTPLAPPNMYAHTFETFKSHFVAVFAALLKDGKINQTYVNQLKDYFKVNEIWEVTKDDTNLKALYDTFVEANLITKVQL